MAKMTLDDLVAQLRAAYGARLASVVLYGSAAAGENVPARSDFNVLVLLDAVDAGALRAASAIARAWHEAGNPPPMTMTMEEWRRSADVFPMEYSDILDRNRVLHGTSPFDGIAVTSAHLRLQLEQQVMGKLLQLRQGALLAGSDTKRQRELLLASAGTILVLCRAVLRLHGERPTGDGGAVAERVGEVGGFDASAIARVARARATGALADGEVSTVLSGYLVAIEQLNAHLDRFAPPA